MEGGEIFQLMKFSRCDVCCIKGGLDMFRPSKSLSECLIVMRREFHSVFQKFPKPFINCFGTHQQDRTERATREQEQTQCM